MELGGESLATLCWLVSVGDEKWHQHMPTNKSASRDAACNCKADIFAD